MKAVVKPEIREGRLSGRITLVMIWKGEQPMDWAASTTPLSTSRREASTSRATKGKAATIRGTMVATVPIEVPRISRDRGITTTIRMRKGTERRMLITKFSTAITGRGRGSTPLGSPTTAMTPRGRPMT